MRWETHVLFAMFIGVVGVKYGYFEANGVLLIGLLLGAFLPDIDTAKSKLGRRVRPVSDFFERFFGHRGVTHSFTGFFGFVLIIGLVSLAAARQLFLPFFFGYLSHLVMDALNPKGLYPLYPIKFKVSGPIKTDSWGERVFFTLILSAALYLFYFA